MNMSTSSKILLILGSGGNVGSSVAKSFAQHGYKVAVAARRLEDTINDEGHLQIKADVSQADSVDSAFDKVISKFGVPNVVVYNAAAVHPVSGENPLDLSVADFNQDLAINTIGAFVAARRTVQGFEKLPSQTPKTFIYTGNLLNKRVMPSLLGMGVGKSATAHLIAVASQGYASKGYNFYYADERKADGGSAGGNINGPNHAKMYLELAETSEQKPWLQTFVGEQGYTEFL